MDINKLSDKIIGAAIYERRHGSNCKRIKGIICLKRMDLFTFRPLSGK